MTRLLSCLALSSVFGLAACGGGGGGTATNPVPDPVTASMRPPQPGSMIGNWEVSKVKVIADTGTAPKVYPGMNLRLAKDSVDVLFDEYLGSGSILGKVLTDWYKGDLVLTQKVDASTFALNWKMDFGVAFNFKKGFWYTTVESSGQLVGADLIVKFTMDAYVPSFDKVLNKWVSKLVDKDVVEVTCVPGKEVGSPVGAWRIKSMLSLQNSAMPIPESLRDPLPYRLNAGNRTVLGKTEVIDLFGLPFAIPSLARSYPDLKISVHLTHVGQGIAQGFLAWQGLPKSVYDQMGAVVDLNLFHTGKVLQGDLKVVGMREGYSPGIYHVYIVLESDSGPLAAGLDSTRSPGWLLPDRAQHAALMAAVEAQQPR